MDGSNNEIRLGDLGCRPGAQCAAGSDRRDTGQSACVRETDRFESGSLPRPAALPQVPGTGAASCRTCGGRWTSGGAHSETSRSTFIAHPEGKRRVASISRFTDVNKTGGQQKFPQLAPISSVSLTVHPFCKWCRLQWPERGVINRAENHKRLHR